MNNKAFKVLVGVFLAESLAVICLGIAGLIMAIWDNGDGDNDRRAGIIRLNSGLYDRAGD